MYTYVRSYMGCTQNPMYACGATADTYTESYNELISASHYKYVYVHSWHIHA